MRLFALVSGAYALNAGVNPIRRVVTLLEDMQQEISAEIEKEADLFKKLECYCSKNDGDLSAKAAEAVEVIKAARAEAAKARAEKKQLGRGWRTS